MNNNAWFIKEKPLLSLQSIGGGAAGSLFQGAADKTKYIDDVFSTYVYTGNETARAITNGIDLSGKGGLVWVKSRNDTHDHHLVDTVRGANVRVESNSSDAQATVANRITGFNSDGFDLGTSGAVNGTSAYDYSSWTFRKQEGFFDIVTWTGNGSSRTIDHSLGSVPGCIMVKNTSDDIDWTVWHRGAVDTSISNDGNVTNTLALNTTTGWSTNNTYFDNGSTPPTATNFTVHTSNRVNANGETYVAYVFAGGKGTTDKAVNFDGTGDYLSLAQTSDCSFGTDDYTVECWIKPTSVSGALEIVFNTGGSNNNTFFFHYADDQISVGNQSVYIVNASTVIDNDKWYHIAACRSGSTLRLFKNGQLVGYDTDNTNWLSGGEVRIGANSGGGQTVNGRISNLRVIKGQALYTDAGFSAPHDPLTQTSQNAISSNVKLICCNGSTTTASTVTPGTITANGDPTAVTNASIFADTEANVFGDDEDQNLIKTGNYVGNGGSSGPVIDLGWEPQWVMIKSVSLSNEWHMIDSMRGINSGHGIDDMILEANTTDGETTNWDLAQLTSTGFQIKQSGSSANGNGDIYVYIAIRRPDSLVGKPAEAGTDVFTMDTGTGSTSIPTFDSGFPVDFAFMRQPGTAEGWATSARLMSKRYMELNTAYGASNLGGFRFDSNAGWATGSTYGSGYQSWMWKRHAGFDVAAYNIPTASGIRHIGHSLARDPEMIWMKDRSNSDAWIVYHKGVNGGTNPRDYYLRLNEAAAESGLSNFWGTSSSDINATNFYINQAYRYTGDHIAMLFASVDGISKVGNYTGSGGSNHQITVGFQPRYLLFKRTDTTGSWLTWDSLRGEAFLKLDENTAQSGWGVITFNSTGWEIDTSTADINASGGNYIYYAHA